MEDWSVEKNTSILQSLLQYSITPKLIETESSHDGLPSFGVSIRKNIISLDAIQVFYVHRYVLSASWQK